MAAPEQSGFARWWTEFVAEGADHVPGGVAGLAVLLLLLAGGVVALLYWWPHRRLPARRRRPAAPVESTAEPDEELDDEDPAELSERPSAELRSLADRYAAAGRYAEAVRERLRAMVRELVDGGVVEHRPGWTVTELAAAAGDAEPRIAAPVAEAAAIFSGVWYGGVTGTAEHDARMRTLADALTAAAPSTHREPAR